VKRILGILVAFFMLAAPALATVSTETTKVTYTCNGTATTYAYPFKVLATSDLLVVKRTGSTETTLAYTTDYTVTGAGGSSGNVVLTAGSKCASGYSLTILRNVPITQLTDYVDGEAFSAESLETALDKATLLLQQQKEQIGRSPKLPTTSTITDIALPNPTANNYIGWNAGATGLENKAVPVVTTATQYEVDAIISYGSGTSYTSATINAALTAIGTTNKATLLLRPGTWVIAAGDADLTIPANVTMKMPAGAVISVATGVTLSINGPLDAGLHQVFSCIGTGRVMFGVGAVKEVYPEWFATNTTPGTTDMTAAIRAAIVSASRYGKVVLDNAYKITGDVSPTNKSDLLITGKGSISLVTGSATAVYAFGLVGTMDNVTIEELSLIGEGDATYNQTAVGSDSGQTLSNITVRNLKITNFNVGISANAHIGGSATKFSIYDNELTNILGTTAGKGYGIHLAKATHTKVMRNSIDNCQRHSIYQGSGDNVNNVISGNVITNHRKGVATGAYLPAIAIARSSGIRCDNNTLVDFFDGGIHVQQEESTTTSAQNISVVNNQLIGRKNDIPGIGIGDPNTGPTAYWTERVDIRGNFITTNRASVGGYEIRVFNGRQIDLSNNTIVLTGVASAAYAFGIGSNTMDAATDLDYVTASGNAVFGTGGDLSAVYGFQFSSEVDTLDSHVTATRNTFGDVKDYENDAVVANKYLVYETGTGGRKGFYAAGDLTPSVYGKNYMVITNGSAKTVTNLDDGEEGQVVRLYFGDGNTTIGHYGTGSFWLAGGADKNMQAGDSLQVMLYDGYWRELAN